METVQRRQTISKLSRIPGYAGGGIIPQPPAQPAVQPSVDPMASKPFMSATGENLGNVLGPKMFAKPNDAQPVTNPKGAPLSPNPVQVAYQNGYAGGGLIDKLKGVFGGGSAPPQPPPPKDPPPEPVATDIWSQTRKRRETEAGLAGGSKVKPGMAKAAMAGMGGMLQGPGTPTSDDIPAKVVDTGEPIKVATGERIVSKKQDSFLQQLAQEKGFPSVDAMLEAGTGEPVGPTIRYDEGKRGASTGASAADLEREKLVAQIPTGGVPGAGPTAPSPQATPGAYDNTKSIARTAMSDVGAAINSGNVGRAINNGVRGMAATQVSGLVDTAGAVSGALKPVGNFISNVATGEDMAPAQAAAQPATAPAARAIASAPAAMPVQPVAAASAVPTPAAPATAAATPSAAAQLGGLDGVNVGNGVTRFDAAGKSPLFTNMTNDQGMASNAALSARGSVSEQDQGAAAALAGNSQGQARAALANDQYNREVSGAKAVNEAGARMNLEYDAKNGKPQAAMAALRLLTQANDGDITRRGQDITERGQQASERGQTARDKLAQADYGLRAQKSALDNEASARLLAAQSAMANAKTDAERQAAEQTFRALQGKYAKETPEQFAYAPGGQSIDPATGQLVTQPGVIFNKATGEIKQPGQAKSIATDPRAIAIRDNKEMTREQKLAELKKMGYQ